MHLNDNIITDIVLFLFWKDETTGVEYLIPTPLRGCYWNETIETVTDKNSVNLVSIISIRIPKDSQVTGKMFLEPEFWYAMPQATLKDYWTIDQSRMPLVATSKTVYPEFVPALPTDVNRILAQENSFIQAGKGNVLRVKQMKNNLYGSEKMHHIRLWC